MRRGQRGWECPLLCSAPHTPGGNPATAPGPPLCPLCPCPLQALALPQLQEEDRDALSALTGLTRLSFSAGGKGAVGPSLRALTRLQALHISLAHRHEHFIVLHPKVDWQALRESLPQLRWLSITHLAANTFFAAPEVTWSDEAPTAHEVDLLVAALPHIQRVQLRCAGCWPAHRRLAGTFAVHNAAPAPLCASVSHALDLQHQPALGSLPPAGCLTAAWQRSMPLARASRSCCSFPTRMAAPAASAAP